MRAAKGGKVKIAQGNVIFCEFGTARGSAGDLYADLVAVQSAIAEIQAVSAEILSANLGVAWHEKENSRLLLATVGRLDNVAFHANLLAANAGSQPERSAADARRLASAGAAAAQWLRTLVAEQNDRIMSTARVLRDVVEQVSALEALAQLCVEPVLAELTQAARTS